MDSTTDQAIVATVVAGDRDAFAELVNRYQRRLYFALYKLTQDADAAEDFTQEAFVRAYSALASYNPAYQFSTWLFQIGFNLWRSSHRRSGRELYVLDEEPDGDLPPKEWPDEAPSPESTAVQTEVNRLIWQAVEALPEDARQIVVLRHVMELSYEEISASTGIPMGTVKSRLARARAQLADALRGVVD